MVRRGCFGSIWLKTFNYPKWRYENIPKWIQNSIEPHQTIPKDPPPHPTPATPRHTPPQRPWGGKMGATGGGRRVVGARISPPHVRCGGVCRGVVGVGCGGGSSRGGLGGSGSILVRFGDGPEDSFGHIWTPFGAHPEPIRKIREPKKYVTPPPGILGVAWGLDRPNCRDSNCASNCGGSAVLSDAADRGHQQNKTKQCF